MHRLNVSAPESRARSSHASAVLAPQREAPPRLQFREVLPLGRHREPDGSDASSDWRDARRIRRDAAPSAGLIRGGRILQDRPSGPSPNQLARHVPMA